MILLEQVHDRVKVAHVFTHHESEVTGVDLLIMDDVVADLVSGPLGIRSVSQDVLDTGEHGNWHGVDVLERNEVCLALPSNDVIEVVRPDLEAILFQVLRVVQDRFNACAVGLVAHIHSKSVIVIEFRVLVDEKFGNELAEGRDIRAKKLRNTTSEPVSAKKLMDTKHAACIGQLRVEERSELEDACLSVRDLSDGA